MQRAVLHVTPAEVDPGRSQSAPVQVRDHIDPLYEGAGGVESEDGALPEACRDERRGRAEPTPRAHGLDGTDFRFLVGVLVMLIAPAYAYAPLSGQIAGGIAFFAGLLIIRNNSY